MAINYDKNSFMGGKKASEYLGVHYRTLYNWDKEGRIETIRTKEGGKRLYNVKKFMENKKKINNNDNNNNNNNDDNNNTNNSIKLELENNIKLNEKNNICYCRVSSDNQKDDLERQVKYMKEKYPDYLIIKDIGSGINFNRKGLTKIIDMAINNKINKLVIAYRDRLTRFGFEMIERILKVYSNCDIIIENKLTLKNKPEDEIVQDVMQILQVFNSRINGMRKYKSKKNKEKLDNNGINLE
jgi:excisionase family DNA binding protein